METDMTQRIDVSEIIESQRSGGFLLMLLALVALASCLEGFDAQIQGYTAPTITKLWHIHKTQFSPVFVFFQFGFLLGAVGFGNLGDVFGRRRMIVGGVLLFGVFTIAGMFSWNVPSLAVTRFASALFLGAAVPNAIALIVDYSPHGRRALNVGIMYTLYTAGGAAGGFLSAWLVPHLGWQSVYLVCGLMAVAFSVVLFVSLPESVRYMIVRHTHQAALAATMRRLAPALEIAPEAQFFMHKSIERVPWVTELFKARRGMMTVALWLAYGVNLMGLIFVTSWMPTVFAASGLSISRSVVATSVFQAGGAAGSIVFGLILDRRNGILRFGGFCLLAVPVIIGVGHAAGNLLLLLPLVFCAGLCVVGTQTGLNALSGGLYPTYLRATSAGWTNGIGRIGAILGPLLGGVLISLDLQLSSIFVIVAIPSLCVAICIFTINRARPEGQSTQPAQPAVLESTFPGE